MACGQSHNLIKVNVEQWIVGEEERTISSPDDGREGRIDLTFAAGAEDIYSLADGARRRKHIA